MIRFFTLIAIFSMLVCANAQACLWNGNGNPESHMVFNHHFSGGKDGTPHSRDIGSLYPPHFTGDQARDYRYRHAEDVFQSDLTDSLFSGRQTMRHMQSGIYQQVPASPGDRGHGHNRYDNELFPGPIPSRYLRDGFLSTGRGHFGSKNHSDIDFFFGEMDFYLTVVAMDSSLLEHFFSELGWDVDEFPGDLWLIAFEGGPGRWVNVFRFAAVLLNPHCHQDPPIATPLPASAILLASGCAGVLAGRRKVRSQGETKNMTATV